MKVTDVLSTARDAITVKRVFGDPYEQDGLTIIPAAVVGGGGGGDTVTTRRVRRARVAASG